MPVTPTIEVDDTLKERSSHGSFELPIETYTDNCEIFHSLYNHWHDEMELIYIESGSGLVRLNKEILRVKARRNLPILFPDLITITGISACFLTESIPAIKKKSHIIS